MTTRIEVAAVWLDDNVSRHIEGMEKVAYVRIITGEDQRKRRFKFLEDGRFGKRGESIPVDELDDLIYELGVPFVVKHNDEGHFIGMSYDIYLTGGS